MGNPNALRQEFFDDSIRGNGLSSKDVQSAIEEVNDRVSVSASPGFTWGKSGNIPTNAWLLNDTVPSNVAGRLSPVDGSLSEIFFGAELPATGTLSFYKRNGATFTFLASITVVAVRKKVITISGVPILKADELACRVTDGSFKNPVAGIVIRGASAPSP